VLSKKNYLNTNVYISMLRLQIGSRQTSDSEVGEYIECKMTNNRYHKTMFNGLIFHFF
jgi:hypothetical protein